MNGLAIVRGAKHGAHQFLYGHGQAETVRKIAVVSVYPANALSSALSKLAKVNKVARGDASEASYRAIGLDEGEGRREPVHGRRARDREAQSPSSGARESDPWRRSQHSHRGGVLFADTNPAAVRRGQHVVEKESLHQPIVASTQTACECCGKTNALLSSVLSRVACLRLRRPLFPQPQRAEKGKFASGVLPKHQRP